VLNASRTSGDDVKQITGNANLEPQSEAEAGGRALERARASKGNMIRETQKFCLKQTWGLLLRSLVSVH